MMEHRLPVTEIVPFFLNHKKLPPQAINERPQMVPAKHAGKPPAIFVIDDESNIADTLTKILGSKGYEAFAFYNGRSAIEAARRRCPDVVLADVMMPRMNGIDTVIAIRRLCLGTRIILFSGQAGTTDLLEGARAKGYSFDILPKPIHPDKLLKKLASLKKPL
jgi:CheY-like chemotaxis protein